MREVNKKKSLLLCIFLGYFGGHKFYEHNIKMGFIYFFTFGLFMIGWFADIFIIASKPEYYFVDVDKNNKKKMRTPESYRKQCPRCKSTRFHAYIEEKVWMEEKRKTYTSWNLNIFKPFTIFNTNEKVVSPEIAFKKTKFLCDDCGKIFK